MKKLSATDRQLRFFAYICARMKQVRPKKNLGQHFLTDLSIARAIADTVDACPSLPVLEVGPGMGVMTQFLLPKPRTIARRYSPGHEPSEPNPTSKFAGKNAIEAPFIFKHGGYYYLFVSWDYCCRGAKSNYRVAVGRSKNIEGPYLDRIGRDMSLGGGTLFLEGDKQEWEATGHCAAYNIDGEDIFICHGYSATRNGAAFLIQRPITWTSDGWPELK